MMVCRAAAAVLAAGLMLPERAAAEHIQICENRPHTLPDDAKVVCSATWQFHAACTGENLWDKWTVTGRTSPPDGFVRPWLSQRILVVGYELVKIRTQPPPPAPPPPPPPMRWWKRWLQSSPPPAPAPSPPAIVDADPDTARVWAIS
jgi:hypothetical protein